MKAALLLFALAASPLEMQYARLADGFDGRVGICSIGPRGEACLNGDQRYSLQSVMKLVVAMAAMDAVDRGVWKLDDAVLVHKRDLSLFVQPIAKLVTEGGYKTTIGDLVRRAVVDSDSAAADILIGKLGGVPAVQRFLANKRVEGVRIDRDERHLQTEIFGLRWKPEYVDPATLDRAIDAVPEAQREAAYRAYQTDARDTATPRGMARLLHALASGRLLSPASTRHLLDVMEQTVTFPDRLKAGAPAGWTVGHKTGSSSTWKGLTVATNDVGVLTAPDGTRIAIAVFIGDTREPTARRAALMAAAARATAGRPSPK